jgi:hypothetical protein
LREQARPQRQHHKRGASAQHHRGHQPHGARQHPRLELAGAHARAWHIDEPRTLAVFLFNGLHGIVEAAAHGREPNRRRAAEQLEQLFFRAVGIKALIWGFRVPSGRFSLIVVDPARRLAVPFNS